MKVSPVPQGTGVPSAEIGGMSLQRISPEKIERAKAIAAGQEPPAENSGRWSDNSDPQVDRLKRFKMRTNVSPDRPLENSDDIPDNSDPSLTAETQSAMPDPSVETPVVTEETKPLGTQFAALAKQRRVLQQEKDVLARERAEFESQRKDAGGEDWKAQLKLDPLRRLEEAGVSYDELTNAILNGQSNPEIALLKAEIKALREGVDKNFSERDTQAEQQVVAEIKREAATLVATGDDFKYTRAMRKSADAARLVHENWKKTGEVMDTLEALTLIEAECKKDYEALSSQLTPAEKIQQQQQAQVPQQGMKTLTNRDGARPPALDKRSRALNAWNRNQALKR